MIYQGEKILLVEDDQTLNFIIKDNLEQNGYVVTSAEDGESAMVLFKSDKFSLCLLDVMLPKKDGFTLAKEIREIDDHVPIIFLTARSMTEDRINGLTIGGDDYMTKPFSMEELLLKIRVFLKRSLNIGEANNDQNYYKVGRFNFYFDSLNLDCNGERKTLTYKEAELLRYFCDNPNKVLSRSDILIQVWGSDDYYLGRSLDVFISRLRKYLSSDENIKILNLHGIGFRFNAAIQKN
ncbi:transcriptional regulatory protein rprY [Aquipluma nitroreducens]|uniref:Transcriptional regulatory protein rprY n=1 Tax=Aquipluma nitroreducens TaxID=2010828 RepID=A0A5K7S7D7_9BACT|nr:response regulator transcription factor [Aquipluma nitroreducens]BBE17234.1 transcriptional regulatory protein rprY [Aquipluma nitroreducens]